MTSEMHVHEQLHKYLWGQDRFAARNLGGTEYTTLDLRLFDLQLNSPFVSTLLVRQEYVRAYDMYMQRVALAATRSGTAATLVTGHPGIVNGKKLFLLYFFARLLQERAVVAIQIDAEEVALYDENGVTLHSAITGSFPPGTYTLSDSFDEYHGPCNAFRRPFLHILQTSSPDPRRWKRWVKVLRAQRYFMDVWTAEEFRALLILEDLDVERGMSLFNKYGPIPSTLLHLLWYPDTERAHISDVQYEAFETSINLQRLSTFQCISDISSEIFVIKPRSDSVREIPALHIPTAFLATALGVAVSEMGEAQMQEFFLTLEKSPDLHPIAGRFFEGFARAQSLIASSGTLLSGSTALQDILSSEVLNGEF